MKPVMLIMGITGDNSVGIPDQQDIFPTPFMPEGGYKGTKEERERFYKAICEIYEAYFFAEGTGYGGFYDDERVDF